HAPQTRLINEYGPTETVVGCCIYEVAAGDAEAGSVPIGKPIANTQLYVLDRSLQLVPMGVLGELYIGGDGVGRGYLERPELTAERFIPDPFSAEPGARMYKTGDLVRYLSDGNLDFIGRVDTQVKVRGFRIELGEIEAVLAQHPAVSEAVVVAREDQTGNKQLVGYVVTPEGKDASGEVRAFLKERLPEYMVPSALVCMAAFPVTQNGKVDRKALPAPDLGAKGTEDFVAPRGAIEEMVAGIWAQVLGLEKVSADSNFFELGGHSLLVMQVISRLRETLKVELPVRSLFGAPTVTGLARSIESALTGEQGPRAPPLVPVPRDGELPTSFAQYRLWFVDQLQPGGSTYNVPMVMHLRGRLDVAALESSLGEIIRRHEVLRTTFASPSGSVVQVISPEVRLELVVENLEGLVASEREAEAQRRAHEEAQRPFELSRGPLLRAKVLRLEREEHVLVLVMHHIVTDGWSNNVLLSELSQLYPVFEAGGVPALPELALQYADYAVWQRQWLQGEVLESQLSYWKKTLAVAPQALELPTDRPRPQVQTSRGALVKVQLPLALSQEVRALSRREGATLFMTLLAAFQALLARYSGQTDIVVGSPIAGRNRQEVEGLIGFFVNTLALRADVQGSLSFKELLARVREVCLGAYAHQELPFEQLVDALQIERDLSRPPVFQVVFLLNDEPVRTVECGGLSLKPLEVDLVTAKLDLTMGLQETGQGLLSIWEYNTDLFDGETVTRMAGHFQKLLEGWVARPEQRLSELSLLTTEERHRLLVEWNSARAEYPTDRTVHRLFEEQVERTPDAPAVDFTGRQLTYREINRRANQVAHHLRTLGVGQEILVGVCVERSLEMMVGILGVLKAGGAYVPLDPSLPAERLGYMLENAGLTVLLTQEHVAKELPFQGTMVRLDSEWEQIAQRSEVNPPELSGAGNLAYAIYTSGSTGRPKGTLLEHRGLCNTALSAIKALGIRPESRVLQFAAFGFDASVWEIFSTLLAGACLCIAPRDALLPGAPLLSVLKEQRITTMTLTPSSLAVLDPEGLEALETVVSVGEACSPALVARWKPGRRFINAYGPTEVTICASFCDEVDEQRPSIGGPLPNVQLYVLDERLEPVPVGVPGELYIGGAGLARGYLGRPELTAERFIPDPFSGRKGARLYRTGDVSRYLSNGELEFIGRRDEQVKIRGFRIELGEVEAVLTQHPAVREAVVVVRESAPGLKQLVGYVVAQGEARPSKAELRTYLRERLPEYMVPSAFVLLDAVPLTPNGKVDRKALPAPDEGHGSDEAMVAPQTELERAVAAIWQEVLHMTKVGTNDRFFDLGGNSLSIIEVQKKLSTVLGLNVKLTKLFQYPTIALLAQHLSQGDTGPELAEVSQQRAKARQELNEQRQGRRSRRATKKDAQDE
ncbi:amino acid adenylation domain-containing protein, partial [Archangium sp.]|uniref:amino acid adenylation domain-containing protein n=1 Tax=Archangium sp. TaxID=1872627 RepID=UPI002D2E3910